MEADKNDITAMIKSYGYTFFHERRKNRKKEIGGGVGIMVRSTMGHKHHKCKSYSSFEHTMVSVKLTNSTKLMIITIYRLLFVPASTFIKEFTELLEGLNAMSEDFILSGDINFHLENNDYHVLTLQSLWTSFNLIQHVQGATHNMNHTLDLVLTPKDSPLIHNLVCDDVQLSDHFLIVFEAEVEVVKQEEKSISYRNIKAVDTDRFTQELKLRLQNETSDIFEERVTNYNSVVNELVHEFAPLKTKTIKIVPKASWFDSEYKDLRKERRRAEKKYKKCRTPENRTAFVNLRKQTTFQALTKKREHYNKKINDCNGSKELYNCVNELLDRKKSSVLPSHDSTAELAERFNKYFVDKICDIRKSFPPYEAALDDSGGSFTGIPLEAFKPATDDEIRGLIMKHGIKCSPADPIPASLLKNVFDSFIPIWRELVNLSLAQGSMECLKCAILSPLIKALDSLMDIEILKNYRPVSNLLFISKLIERVVDLRTNDHMDVNNLHSAKQYAYKDEHSTELLLTKVVNDLLLACDKKIPTLVMFLDLSAAFDTVDQGKLLKTLHDDIGIRGVALKWFESYLCGRTQKVKIGDSYSSEVVLDFGVTQGSILGPKLFNIYTKPFPTKLHVVKVSVEGFADDHQLLKQFNLIFQVEVLGEGIEKIFVLIEKWMSENFLKLNSGKTKIMIIAPDGVQQEITINGTFIDGKCIRFVDTAKNLGVYIDSTLSFEFQIQRVVMNCFSTIRLLSRIKFFLTTEQLNQIVCPLVLSIIDYCNSLYYGLSAELIGKLQSVQNSAARLVCKVNGYDRVGSDELFHRLHWLKVRERIVYKVLLIVFKCITGHAPVDLMNMLKLVKSSRTKKLEAQKCNGVMGDRAFSVCGPRLWNALPLHLRTIEDVVDFKKKLKTYLFTNGDNFNICVNMK